MLAAGSFLLGALLSAVLTLIGVGWALKAMLFTADEDWAVDEVAADLSNPGAVDIGAGDNLPQTEREARFAQMHAAACVEEALRALLRQSSTLPQSELAHFADEALDLVSGKDVGPTVAEEWEDCLHARRVPDLSGLSLRQQAFAALTFAQAFGPPLPPRLVDRLCQVWRSQGEGRRSEETGARCAAVLADAEFAALRITCMALQVLHTTQNAQLELGITLTPNDLLCIVFPRCTEVPQQLALGMWLVTLAPKLLHALRRRRAHDARAYFGAITSESRAQLTQAVLRDVSLWQRDVSLWQRDAAARSGPNPEEQGDGEEGEGKDGKEGKTTGGPGDGSGDGDGVREEEEEEEEGEEGSKGWGPSRHEEGGECVSSLLARWFLEYAGSADTLQRWKRWLEVTLNERGRPDFVGEVSVEALEEGQGAPALSHLRLHPTRLPAEYAASARLRYQGSTGFRIRAPVYLHWPVRTSFRVHITLEVRVAALEGHCLLYCPEPHVDRGFGFLTFVQRPQLRLSLQSTVGRFNNLPRLHAFVESRLLRLVEQKATLPHWQRVMMPWARQSDVVRTETGFAAAEAVAAEVAPRPERTPLRSSPATAGEVEGLESEEGDAGSEAGRARLAAVAGSGTASPLRSLRHRGPAAGSPLPTPIRPMSRRAQPASPTAAEQQTQKQKETGSPSSAPPTAPRTRRWLPTRRRWSRGAVAEVAGAEGTEARPHEAPHVPGSAASGPSARSQGVMRSRPSRASPTGAGTGGGRSTSASPAQDQGEQAPARARPSQAGQGREGSPTGVEGEGGHAEEERGGGRGWGTGRGPDSPFDGRGGSVGSAGAGPSDVSRPVARVVRASSTGGARPSPLRRR